MIKNRGEPFSLFRKLTSDSTMTTDQRDITLFESPTLFSKFKRSLTGVNTAAVVQKPVVIRIHSSSLSKILSLSEPSRGLPCSVGANQLLILSSKESYCFSFLSTCYIPHSMQLFPPVRMSGLNVILWLE